MSVIKYKDPTTGNWIKINTKGEPGADGKSAYQYALDAGYTGTEDEFAAKLAGNAVSSWNDLTDRPFYSANISPIFNGDLTGRETVYIDENVCFVKLSSKYLSIDEAIGSTVVMNINGTEETLELTNENVFDLSSMFGTPGIMISDGEIVSIPKDSSLNGLTLTAGTWFLYIPNEFYIKSISCLPDEEEEVIHKLDNKYIDAEWMATNSSYAKEFTYIELDTAFGKHNESDNYTVTIANVNESMYDLTHGKNYLIVWDNKEYILPCKGEEGTHWKEFGNEAIIDSSKENTSEPFYIKIYADSNYTMDNLFYCFCESTTPQIRSIGIYDYTYTETKLPQKFLPDHLPKIETIVGKKLISTICSTRSLASYGGAFGANISFVNTLTIIPESVTVILDGWEYKDLAVITTPLGCIAGNLSKVNALQGTSFEDTGEPFMLGIDEYGCLLATDMTQSTTHNIIVKIPDEEIIHKLDNKFIDAEWMATVTKGAEPFDGDITGKESIYVYDIGTYPIYLVKITDSFFPVETVVGSNVTIAIGEEETTDTVPAESVSSPFGELSTVVGDLDDLNVISLGQDIIYNGKTITAGTWFKCAIGGIYVKWLSCISTEDIANKLPKKFLPELIATDDGNGNVVISFGG